MAQWRKIIVSGSNAELSHLSMSGDIDLTGNITGSSTSTGSFGYLAVSGDTTIGGNLTFGDSDTDFVSFSADITSDIIPDASDSYDLGSTGQRWNDVWVSGSLTANGGPHSLTTEVGEGGAIDIDADGALTIDGGSITIGGDSDVAVDIDSSTLDIDASGAITIDGATSAAVYAATTMKVSGSTGLNVGDDVATLNFDGLGALSETGMTTFSLTPSGVTDIDAGGAVTIDSSETISIGGDSVGRKITVGGDTGTRTEVELNAILVDINAGTSGVTIDAGATSNFTTSAGDIDINAAANLDLDGATVDIDSAAALSLQAAAASDFTTSAGLLTLNGAAGVQLTGAVTASTHISSSGNLYLSGTADIDGNVDIDNTTTTIDSSDAISLDAGAASNFTTTAGALTLEGKVGVDIKEDGTSVITIDTDRDTLFASTGGSTSDPDVEFDGYVRHDGQVEVTDTTDSTSITTGALVVDGGVGIAKDLVVGGMVTAQEFHTEFVSASIMYSSGSTKFGDTIDDIHSFTGSINQSGSFNLNDGNMTITDTLTATNIGAFTSTGAIDFDSQDMTNVDIDSGAIDGVTIGGASAGAITGTTIDATTDFTIDGLVITADDITNDAGLEIQTAAGDITLDPGGNNVLPGSDSADDLGASGTAWNKLWVDAIELNAQGSVTNAVSASIGYISGSGNMKIDGAATFGGGYGSTGTTISSAGVIQSNGNIETAGSFVIGSADMNETDLEKLDGITDGTAAANKALVLDASSDISSGINDFQVSKLEIDSANDYLDVDTDLKVIASADIVLNPGGNNVKPGGDSEDDLGVSGTAWRTLYVDSIKMNGQGSIDGATHITGSGNLEISGNISGSINTTGSFSDLMAVGAGASVAASSASLVSFRNNANSQFGYLASADTQAITTGIVGYNTSTGNLTISSVIDGGSF